MKYCIYCGQKLIDEAKFCFSCGKRIDMVTKEESKEPEETKPEIKEEPVVETPLEEKNIIEEPKEVIEEKVVEPEETKIEEKPEEVITEEPIMEKEVLPEEILPEEIKQEEPKEEIIEEKVPEPEKVVEEKPKDNKQEETVIPAAPAENKEVVEENKLVEEDNRKRKGVKNPNPYHDAGLFMIVGIVCSLIYWIVGKYFTFKTFYKLFILLPSVFILTHSIKPFVRGIRAKKELDIVYFGFITLCGFILTILNLIFIMK